MEITITGSAFDTGVSLRNHIKEKLEIIAKKLRKGKIHKIHTVVNKDGINFLCKIDVIEEIDTKAVIHASHEATDVYACVDLTIKKIEEQFIKRKEKIIDLQKYEGSLMKEKISSIKPEDVEEVYLTIGEDEEDENAKDY